MFKVILAYTVKRYWWQFPCQPDQNVVILADIAEVIETIYNDNLCNGSHAHITVVPHDHNQLPWLQEFDLGWTYVE